MSVIVAKYGSMTAKDFEMWADCIFNQPIRQPVYFVDSLQLRLHNAYKSGDKAEIAATIKLINIQANKNTTEFYKEAKKVLYPGDYTAFTLLCRRWGINRYFGSSKCYVWSLISHWDSESDLTTSIKLELENGVFTLVTSEEWGMSYYEVLNKQILTVLEALSL